MAIRIDAAADLLSRTTNFPAFGSWTAMCWVMRVVDQGSDECLMYISNNSSFGAYAGCLFNSTSKLSVDGGLGGGSGGGIVTFALNTWYHCALVFDDTANTISTYVDGVSDRVDTGHTGTTTWGYETVGGLTSGGGNMMNGRVAAYKSYNAALTVSEVADEMRCYCPVRTAGLHRWSPFLDSADVRDYGGVVNWTASGTLTTEDGPPIAWSISPRYRTYIVSAGGTVFTQSLTADFAVSGAVVREVRGVKAGALSPIGLVRKDVARLYTGSFAPGAVLRRSVAFVKSGEFAPLGALAKVVREAKSGAFSPGGVVSRAISKSVIGTFAPMGGVVKRVEKSFSGLVTPLGALVRVLAKVIVFAGSFAPVGAVVKRVGVFKSGGVTPIGSVTKVSLRSFLGSIGSVGGLSKRVSRAFSGVVTPVGVLTKVLAKVVFLTGALSPVGSVTKSVSVVKSGVVSGVGSVTKRVGKGIGGGVNAAGGLVKRVGKSVGGVIAPIGNVLPGAVRKAIFSGIISPIGTLIATFISGGGVVEGVKSMLPWVRRKRRL